MITPNVHCQWHPLKHVMIGRTYDRSFFDEMPQNDIKHMLQRIADETEEDFQGLAALLMKHGVEIIRPHAVQGSIEQYLMDHSSVPRPPMAPRDAQLVMGNKLYVVAQDHPAILDKLSECCQGPMVRFPGHHKRGFKQADAPSITQLGRDIIVDRSANFHHVEIKWLSKQLPDHRINQISLGGHNDGDFMLIKPGVGLARQGIGIDWAQLLPGWHMLEVSSDELNPYRRYTAGRSKGLPKWWIAQGETLHEFARFVDAWLSEWVGYVAETIFSLNALIIDETKVVFSQHDRRVFDFLEHHGIEPMVSPYRHHYFWDNGIHCSTLDLHRQGDMFDLFAQRSDALIM